MTEHELAAQIQAGLRTLSPEEKRERYGDPRMADRKSLELDYENDLVRRFRAGLPLSLDGKRRARRIIRGQ
jgi:hypothetical protein